MKKLIKKQVFQSLNTGFLLFILLLINGNFAFAADKADSDKIDTTTDGLTIIETTRFTETEARKGIDWSAGYTKYQIAPVEVSFRKNWKETTIETTGT